MKHLQSDLSTLFQRSLPDLPSIQLPSGSAYIRPMSISAIKANVVYIIKPYAGIVMPIKPPHALFTYTKPRHRLEARVDLYTRFIIFDDVSSEYFHTSDEAYIHMFLNYPRTINSNLDVYNRLYTIYPEYFI